MNKDEQHLRRQLAAAYRLLYHFGWDDLIYSHMSAKIPDTEYYLTNRFGLSFNEITASNLVKVNTQGEVIGEGVINPAGFILHSAIYESRANVGGIIHTHTTEGIAVSADKDGLWPINQRASGIIKNLGYHDYQGVAVEHNEKQLLIKNLGQKDYLILRNHGLLTVGNDIGQAFLNMRNLQLSCQIQVLCDYNRVKFIPSKIIEDNEQRKAKFNKNLNISQMAWLVLLKMVEHLYPDYKK